MKKLFVLFTACLFVFTLSCKFNSSPAHESVQVEEEEYDLVTPYSEMDAETLISLKAMGTEASAADPDVVDWKVARFFAVVEKIKFENFYQTWTGAKVSGKPVIIYYPESNKPRYYEFRVIKDGKEVGSITCNASKKEGNPVAYVSEMTHKVKASVAKELVSIRGNLSLTAVNYPNSFVMRERTDIADTAEAINFMDAKDCTPLKKDQVFIPVYTNEFLENATQETLDNMKITPEIKEQLLKEFYESEARYKQFWNEFEVDKTKILALTDEEIEEGFLVETDSAPKEIGTKRVVDSEYVGRVHFRKLDSWYDKREWYNPGGGCVPYTLTYFLLGLGGWYKDVNNNWQYVPGYNNLSAIKKMCDDVHRVMGMTLDQENKPGQGYFKTKRAVKHLTNGNHSLGYWCCHWWGKADRHLKKYALPVISVRVGSKGDKEGHARVIIGTAIYRVKLYHEFWWFRWTTNNDGYWYFMHDNGYDAKRAKYYEYEESKKHGNFWESKNERRLSEMWLIY